MQAKQLLATLAAAVAAVGGGIAVSNAASGSSSSSSGSAQTAPVQPGGAPGSQDLSALAGQALEATRPGGAPPRGAPAGPASSAGTPR